VERTQATAAAIISSVLEIGSRLNQDGSLPDHNADGDVSFEFSLAARRANHHKFQGLTTADSMYLIMPDRLQMAIPRMTSRRKRLDRTIREARAYHGGICEDS